MSRTEHRTHCVEKIIRFTPDEWERVRKLHEELTRYALEHRSFASYARRMLSERRIHVTEIRPLTDPEPIAREIDRIGVNVNQIAHWANANERITPEQVAEIRASFDRIERLLGDLFAEQSRRGEGRVSMAVVKLGRPVKSNLGGSNGAMAHIIDPAKTDGGRLVGSNYERTRTDYDALAEGMLDDNRRSPKGIRKDSRLAYHIKLSFSPDDPVTPEKVHELGMEFARRITGGEYRFVVTTHTDRHHLHDHIMVCAASRYGKHLKAELPKDIIDQWRAVSDEICRREDLRVVFNPVVEEQARKMRGSETTTDDAPTTRERDPERIDETAGPGAATPPRTTRRAEGEEPVERRYGMSMEEIYASAKGMGVKDRTAC